MNHVLLFDGTSGDSYIELDLGANHTTVYISLNVRLPAAAKTYWEAHAPVWIAEWRDSSAAMQDQIGLKSTGQWVDNHFNTNALSEAGASTDTWETFFYRYKSSGTPASTLWLGSAAVFSGVSPGSNQTRKIRIGIQGPPGDVASQLYVDRLLLSAVGPGDDDLWNDDFESGLSGSYTVVGSVSVVTDPADPAGATDYALHPATALAAAAGDTVVHLTWTGAAQPDAVGFHLYRGTSSGGETLYDTLGISTSYDDTAVVNGTEYFYYLKAINGVGDESGATDEVSTTPGPPPFTRHAVTIKIYDLASSELADISGICLERTWRPRHNAAASLVVQCPAGDALLTATADDGYPNLRKGNRKLLAWEDGVIFFHGRIDTVERVGDGTRNLVTVTAWDSWMELGFDADGRAGRPVRGSTTQPTAGDPFGVYDGNFISPKFASSVAAQDGISGPDLIYQLLVNSVNTGAESDPAPGEGPLPIHVDVANFDLDVPPAIDLSPSDTMDWPVLIGDFVSQLVDTGVVDVRMRPIDPAEGLDPYEMNEIFAASSIGTDRTATVHFDYWTGSKNASACRHVESFFAEINNKLYDYLGPRIDQSHWRANITPGSPGTTVDPTASRALYGGPGADKGAFMSIRVFDSVGDEASSRPLYLALWNAEQGYRVEPRDVLFITPNPDAKALFEPPGAYHVGDLVAINTGGDFGIALAAAQRVYGYDKTWDREGIARVSELLTSADPG